MNIYKGCYYIAYVTMYLYRLYDVGLYIGILIKLPLLCSPVVSKADGELSLATTFTI
jgi:hypothetical protein